MSEKQHSKVLGSKAKSMIYTASEHFRNEAVNGYLDKTAEVMGVSSSTVVRIRREQRDTGTLLSPKRPKREPNKSVDDFDQNVIRNKIAEFYTVRKQLPTLHALHRVLQDDIAFPGSMSKLLRMLREMGYRWRKTRDNRKVLIEKPNIVSLRLRFYQKMKEFKDRGLQFVFIYETWIDTAYTVRKCWQGDNTPGVIPPCNQGQRIIVVHAGSRNGFVPGSLLAYKARSTTGDYHCEMNGKNLTKWVEEMLIPNLDKPSVIVMDNASYHSMQTDKCPTSATRKADIQDWLRKQQIPFTTCMLRPQLLQLARQNRPSPQYTIDQLLQSHGHEVLRLPPYHPDFNPIELFGVRYDDFLQTTIKAFDGIGAERWRGVCDHVEWHIEQCRQNDHAVNDHIDSLIIDHKEDTSSESGVSDT